MHEILFHYYKINPTTWIYVSSLSLIGFYFKFSRFWSVRNLDLILLILLAPGLVAVIFGQQSIQIAKTLAAVQPPPEFQQPAEEQPPTTPVMPKPPSVSSDTPVADLPAGDVPAELPDTLEEDTLDDEPKEEKAVDDVPLPEEFQEPFAELEAALDSQNPGECRSRVVEIKMLAAVDEQVLKKLDARIARYKLQGWRVQIAGYLWLFGVSLLLMIRLLLDPVMVRRPLLRPNLSVGGLTFIGCSLFVFLMANVITSTPTEEDLQATQEAGRIVSVDDGQQTDTHSDLKRFGPGHRLLLTLFSGLKPWAATKAMAFISQLAIVVGMILIGYRHFGDLQMGIGAATLYLLLPYTALMTGRVDHVLPGALLIWAVMTYRMPVLSGIFLGLASGVVYYPLFLLPLWLSFYWHRGLFRFLIGFLSMLLVLVLSLVFTSSDVASFWAQFQQMFGLWLPVREGLEGIWGGTWDSSYRIPILAAYIALCFSFALWPPQKNYGTLLSCTAAVMVAVQFWHGHGGGTILAWYLPLLLMVIFRPNLEDRVATLVVRATRGQRRAAAQARREARAAT